MSHWFRYVLIIPPNCAQLCALCECKCTWGLFCCCTEIPRLSPKAGNSNTKKLPSRCALLLYSMALFTSAPLLQGSTTSTDTAVASADLRHTHLSMAWTRARSARVSLSSQFAPFNPNCLRWDIWSKGGGFELRRLPIR